MTDETGGETGKFLAELGKKLAEDHENILLSSEIKYPVTINRIQVPPFSGKSFTSTKVGRLVGIRPVNEQYDGKTFLGIYLGDLPVQNIVALHKEEAVLVVSPHMNPAIFVPELDKIIYGYESWWGEIKSEEELHQITDEDIQNVWYVRALKQLGEKS